MFNSVFWVLIRMSCFLFENINCIHMKVDEDDDGDNDGEHL